MSDEKQTAPAGGTARGGGNGNGSATQSTTDAQHAQLVDEALRNLATLDPVAEQGARKALADKFRRAGIDAWTIYRLDEAFKTRPPLVYVVQGLFLLASLSICYGAPACFKSFLLADLALCVAAGLPWLPPLPGKTDVAPRSTLGVPVLWADFDQGKRRTDERFEALARARDLRPGDIPLSYVTMPTPWLNTYDSLAMDELGALIARLTAKLVVVDNLGTVLGKTDENSAEMATIMANFRRIAEQTGAAVLLVHHQRKDKGIGNRAGESLRGHSSIEASLDLALRVDRDERSDVLQFKSTKARGPDVPPGGARFTYQHRDGSDELSLARFYGWAIEDLGSDRAIRMTILDTIMDSSDLSKGALVDTVKAALPDPGVNRIREMIDFLVLEGELALQLGPRGAKTYRISRHKQEPLGLQVP